MKNVLKALNGMALAALVLAPCVASAEKISKHTVDGFEEWYWKGTASCKRGEAHTFWIKGLTENTAITGMEVYYSYSYTEDGEKWTDEYYASESCEVENASGGFDKYALLTAEDWEDIPGSQSKLTFTIYVDGWEPDDEQTTADISFTFGHSAGDGDYPEEEEEEEPEPVEPTGSASNPYALSIKDSAPSSAQTVECTFASDFVGDTYHITASPALVAGRKYYFGIGSDTCSNLTLSVGGVKVDLETEAKVYEDWPNATEAWEFVPTTGGTLTMTVEGTAGNTFTLYSAALAVRKPADHEIAGYPVIDGAAMAFVPGYENDPLSGAYDSVIDQCLFEVTGFTKNETYVFATGGADVPLIMRLYDSTGKILAENLYVSDSDCNVRIGWTAPSSVSMTAKYYVGVCEQLEEGEEPSENPVALLVKSVDLDDDEVDVKVVPTPLTGSPFDVQGADILTDQSLGETAWTNLYVISARAGVEYHVKAHVAADGSANGLKLAATLFTLSGTTLKPLDASTKTKYAVSDAGTIDPDANANYFSFKPTVNGTIYVGISVADGDWGWPAGLDYGPYEVCAVASGDYGVLQVNMQGADEDSMQWKILKFKGKNPSVTEVYYPANSSIIAPAGDYTLAAKSVTGFATPDQSKGFTNIAVRVDETVTATYKYTDTSDPKDDYVAGKSGTITYAATQISPNAAGVKSVRSLWDNDVADWFKFSGTAGVYYKFAFTEKTGAPIVNVYLQTSKTLTGESDLELCDYVLVTDPTEAVQICAEVSGTYFVKVSHADAQKPTDSSYTMLATSANPGTVKIASATLSVKEGSYYADLEVGRTSVDDRTVDGIVRVKYFTQQLAEKPGVTRAAPGVDYWPTNGVITWAENDKAGKVVRVKLIPELEPEYTGDKKFDIQFRTFDETEVAAGEYIPAFSTDSKTKLPLTNCVVSITETTPRVVDPGTIQVVCDVPKKPVYTVTAGDKLTIPFERVLGWTGNVGVKCETVKGTANKSGETDYVNKTETFVWYDGEGDEKNFVVQTKTTPTDWTAVKTFTVKLTALSGTQDEVYYDKPTLPATIITVNIENDKFATTFANWYKDKTVLADLKAQGITAVKEGTTGTWYLKDDGSFFFGNSAVKGKVATNLTFTVTGPGRFFYVVPTEEDSVLETNVLYAATGSKKLTVEDEPEIIDFWFEQLAAATPEAPTVDKAVLAAGEHELCFVRDEGVSYRVYCLSANATNEQGKAMKLGDPETEVKEEDGKFFVDFAYTTNETDKVGTRSVQVKGNLGKYTWKVDAFYEDGPVTNAAKSAWNLQVADTTKLPQGAELAVTRVTGVDAYGEAVDIVANGAVTLWQGNEVNLAVGAQTSTVKIVSGALPTGLSLKQVTLVDKTKRYYIAGTPSKAGTYRATLQETASYTYTYYDTKTKKDKTATVTVAGTTTTIDFTVEAAGLTQKVTGPGRFLYCWDDEGTLKTNVIYVASGSKTVMVSAEVADKIEWNTYESLAAVTPEAPTVDKAVLAAGTHELCFVRDEGVSYRVYCLSANATNALGKTMKLGDPETEVKEEDGRFLVDFAYTTNTTYYVGKTKKTANGNLGKYTWKVDAFYEDGPVTNTAKSAWNLQVADTTKLPQGAELAVTRVTGVDAYGEAVDIVAKGAVTLWQGNEVNLAVGAVGSTVKRVVGALPTGLSLKPLTLADKTKRYYILGEPSKAGTYQVTLQETASYTYTYYDTKTKKDKTATVTVAGTTTTIDFTVEPAGLSQKVTGPGRFTYCWNDEGTLKTNVIYVASGEKEVKISEKVKIEWSTYESLTLATPAAPTVDKAVLLEGKQELCLKRTEGVSYRVYCLSANATNEQGKAMKLGDPETEVKEEDGKFLVDFAYTTNTTYYVGKTKKTANGNLGKYTWKADAYYEGGTVTNAGKTTWSLTIVNPADWSKLPLGKYPMARVTGADVYGNEGAIDAAGATNVVLRQGVKVNLAVGEVGATVKLVSGKLPDGLSLKQVTLADKSKQYYITGTPSKGGAFQAAFQETMSFKNGSKSVSVAGPTTALEFEVVAAGTSVGTFDGLATTFDTEDGLRSLAKVQFTSTKEGKLSAKVYVGGKQPYTFSDTGYAYLDDTGDLPKLTAELPLIQKLTVKEDGKTTSVTVTNWLTCTVVDAPETNNVARNAEMDLEIAFEKLATSQSNEYTDDVWYQGKACRDNSKVKDWVAEATAFQGYYTVSLANIDAQQGVPKGNGYLTLTVDNQGKVKIVGMLADGTTYSGSSLATYLVDRDDVTSMRIPLYACKSPYVFGGWLQLTPAENEDGSSTIVVTYDAPETDLVWKNDLATATREGEEGFALSIYPVGGWYDTVKNLQAWFTDRDFSVDLPSWEDDAEELIPYGYETYAFAANPCGTRVDVLGNTLSVDKQTLVKDHGTNVWDKCVNISNVKLTFARGTGVLSGTFDLWYEGENASGKYEQKSMTGLKHNGVLLLSRGSEGYLEDDVWTSGFYLAPQTVKYLDASGNEKTRKWTGSYRFDLRATPVERDWSETEAE